MKYIALILAALHTLNACSGAVPAAQAQAIPPQPAATVTQADLSINSAACLDSWTQVPGLQTSITVQTEGQPVKISYFLNFRAAPKAVIHVLPVISDTRQSQQQVSRAIGDFAASGQTDSISYSRIYWLDAGRQDFALLFTCQSAVTMLRGTLTVELLQ